MTGPFELRRRTPAGQLRYLAEQVARTNGLDPDDRTRLAAVRLGLEMLADELEGADEQAQADSYAAMANAPLRPETITAINVRIHSGDVPVRKVKAREPAVEPPGFRWRYSDEGEMTWTGWHATEGPCPLCCCRAPHPCETCGGREHNTVVGLPDGGTYHATMCQGCSEDQGGFQGEIELRAGE